MELPLAGVTVIWPARWQSSGSTKVNVQILGHFLFRLPRKVKNSDLRFSSFAEDCSLWGCNTARVGGKCGLD